MTVATDLIAALTPHFGEAAPEIATSIPTMARGGDADVVVFPNAPEGCVYVSAGLTPLQQRELVLVTATPAEWCAPFLSRLARAATQRRLDPNGTTPLGDGPVHAIAITRRDDLGKVKVGGKSIRLDLVIGVTADELAACRSRGVPFVIAALERGGVYPRTSKERASVLASNDGPAPFAVEPTSTRGELAPQGVDMPRARTLALAILLGWLVLHVATPASYYASDDVYDERFAWRMFSAVRVQQCSLGATETIDGRTRPIALQSVLPAPWVALLQRNRPAVIHRFLDWRCLSDARPTDVALTHTCQSVTGETLPAVHRALHCAGHVYEESTDE